MEIEKNKQENQSNPTSSRPDFIDNIDENTMSAALRSILGFDSSDAESLSSDSLVSASLGKQPAVTAPLSGEAGIDELRIASAYCSLSGLFDAASVVKKLPKVRLLLGAEPIGDASFWQRRLAESKEECFSRRLGKSLEQQQDGLKTECDNLPFDSEYIAKIHRLAAALRAGSVETRLFKENFLHAKAYIFSRAGTAGESGGIIAGSSNLTASGLRKNYELNLGRYDAATLTKALSWFDGLWDRAEPFDLIALLDGVLQLHTPYEIFMRVLWELYGDEFAVPEPDSEEFDDINTFSPTTFQKHGVARAMSLLKEYGGAIVADEVGLGKTFIAAAVMKIYERRGQRALLICPAALRDTVWKQFSSDYSHFIEAISYEELGAEEQIFGDNPNRKSRLNITQRIQTYRLVIIDEAHNYRNDGVATRSEALKGLLLLQPMHVLMLTATPVNNSLMDLHQLIKYYIRQDDALAHRGILSIEKRFNDAIKVDPHDLSPDALFPIIDATTIKRTRRFIQKYYKDDQIPVSGGSQITIQFPEPKAITVNYEPDNAWRELFRLIKNSLDPDSDERIVFARYRASAYIRDGEPDEEDGAYRWAESTTGLLRSALLKRFESSIDAFNASIGRLIDQHRMFLEYLDKGFVVNTAFFRGIASTDNDEDFDEILSESDKSKPAEMFDVERMRKDVEADLGKLEALAENMSKFDAGDDPKLRKLRDELEKIAADAAREGTTNDDITDKRKVIIFSFFSDTVRYIEKFLNEEAGGNKQLQDYAGRIAIVVGTGKGEDSDKAKRMRGFSPRTAGGTGMHGTGAMAKMASSSKAGKATSNKATGEGNNTGTTRDATQGSSGIYDILISTDVLAEGANLQQARHIINYDMPWNPMRLVQRHGRIDRINSSHPRVYMRTIFPGKLLDELLGLEKRIKDKIAMAAASVGVQSPISTAESRERVFNESLEEIKKLKDEDASLFVDGGTVAATQSGEEYRRMLSLELERDREAIVGMPWKSGAAMSRSGERGIFFCAKVGNRIFLRFVHAQSNWSPRYQTNEPVESTGTKVAQGVDTTRIAVVEEEMGRCLRLIQCEKDEKPIEDSNLLQVALDLWPIARETIYNTWLIEADPANRQPKLKRLNTKVADYIRQHSPERNKNEVDRALDIVETTWPPQDGRRLGDLFGEGEGGKALSEKLVDMILKSGLKPPKDQERMPAIEREDIKLVVWLALV